eukprot:scaffold676703_cov39-Prasinocladus_malaysianus.AAC.1
MQLVEEWEGSVGKGDRDEEEEGEGVGLPRESGLLKMVKELEKHHTDSDDFAMQFITAHKAKGKEFAVVYVADDFNGPYRRPQ